MNKNNNGLFSESQVFYYVNGALLIFLILFFVLNTVLLRSLYGILGMKMVPISFASEPSISLSGSLDDDVVSLVIAQGVPKIYGAELALSFDNVQDSMNKMAVYDPDYGRSAIKLQGEALTRYTAVATQISCEFCCGAKSIVFADGKAACGCAHSQAMRGLLAYLLTKYPDRYSDDELLRELARWKGRYFPKQMMKKMAEQVSGQKRYTPDISALLLGVDVSEYGTDASAPMPSSLENLPDMVGGC